MYHTLISKSLGFKLNLAKLIAAFFFISYSGNLNALIKPGDLVENSPFVKANSVNPNSNKSELELKKPLENNRFILKGVALFGKRYHFSVTDNKSKNSQWIAEDETINGFRIVSYDLKNFTITYEWNDQNKPKVLYTGKMTLNPHSSAIKNNSSLPQKIAPQITKSLLPSNDYNPPSNKRALNPDTPNSSIIYFDQRSEQKGNQNTGLFNFNTRNSFANSRITIEKEKAEINSDTTHKIPPGLLGKTGSLRGINQVNNPSGKKPSHL